MKPQRRTKVNSLLPKLVCGGIEDPAIRQPQEDVIGRVKQNIFLLYLHTVDG